MSSIFYLNLKCWSKLGSGGPNQSITMTSSMRETIGSCEKNEKRGPTDIKIMYMGKKGWRNHNFCFKGHLINVFLIIYINKYIVKFC